MYHRASVAVVGRLRAQTRSFLTTRSARAPDEDPNEFIETPRSRRTIRTDFLDEVAKKPTEATQESSAAAPPPPLAEAPTPTPVQVAQDDPAPQPLPVQRTLVEQSTSSKQQRYVPPPTSSPSQRPVKSSTVPFKSTVYRPTAQEAEAHLDRAQTLEQHEVPATQPAKTASKSKKKRHINWTPPADWTPARPPSGEAPTTPSSGAEEQQQPRPNLSRTAVWRPSDPPADVQEKQQQPTPELPRITIWRPSDGYATVNEEPTEDDTDSEELKEDDTKTTASTARRTRSEGGGFQHFRPTAPTGQGTQAGGQERTSGSGQGFVRARERRQFTPAEEAVPEQPEELTEQDYMKQHMVAMLTDRVAGQLRRSAEATRYQGPEHERELVWLRAQRMASDLETRRRDAPPPPKPIIKSIEDQLREALIRPPEEHDLDAGALATFALPKEKRYVDAKTIERDQWGYLIATPTHRRRWRAEVAGGDYSKQTVDLPVPEDLDVTSETGAAQLAARNAFVTVQANTTISLDKKRAVQKIYRTLVGDKTGMPTPNPQRPPELHFEDGLKALPSSEDIEEELRS